MPEMPIPQAVFHAEFIRAIDADTLVVSIDRFLDDRSSRKIRLLGVDTPEMTGPSRPDGVAAREWVLDWIVSAFDVPHPLVIATSRPDSFGRILARVWRKDDGQELSQALIDAGHGKAVNAWLQIAKAREAE